MLDGPFLLVGLGLGARHATDPDHVAALWNFIVREHKPWPALRYAALWGLGHATSFTCVGVAILTFGVTPAPWFERITEGLVGLMLLTLGLFRHSRPHALQPAVLHGPHAAKPWPRHETYFVGLVHGLAGSAAIALLLLTTASSRPTALLYLLLFGAGSVLGMVLITLGVLLPLSRFARRLDVKAPLLSLVPNLLSATLGALILLDAIRG